MFGTVDVHSSLQEAVLLHQSGQLKQAATIYQQVLDIEPENANALHLLGLVSHQSGQPESAIILIKQALDISPNQLNFLHNLANILRELGQFEEAVQVYRQVIQLQPDTAEVYNSLGNALQNQGKLVEAIRAYRTAIILDSEYIEAYNNLGNALQNQGKLVEAIRAYRTAITLDSVCAEAYNNLGNALQRQFKLEKAIQAYWTAITLDSEYVEAYNNLGMALGKQRELDQSARAYQTALRINPEYAEAHYNLGTLLLLQGDFVDGWSEYEWRWKCSKFPSRKPNFLQPIWSGSSLSGKSILVWTEQGMGDQMMFASMFHSLLQMDVNIVVECPKRLTSLFNRSFPFSCISKSNPPSQKLLDSSIDYQSSISSLARWLLPDEESFPKNPSYLKACADKAGGLRDEYQQLAPDRLLIGISWKSVNEDTGKLKSTSLIQWTGLLSRKDCFFINLQYGDVGEEIEAFTGQTGISVYQDKGINSLGSLDDFAAQVSALDLVISISNTTVHMAGALGKLVWTLLHYVPDWRWQLDRSDTPWYPSMKLYRQPSLGDWDNVFQQVQSDLGKFVDHTLNAKVNSHAWYS